jgi:hypothetical protein
MTTSDSEISNLVQQHQAVQAHMKFLINAVSRLYSQSVQEMPDSTSLKNRITLYRWSLYDFKEAIQRHIELDKRIFLGGRSTEGILREHQGILEQINNAIELAENAADNKTSREALNVYLIKIIMAVNTICETIGLHMTKEDELVRQH